MVSLNGKSALGQSDFHAIEEPATARVFVAELDNAARSHLKRAEVFLNTEHYEESIDTIRSILEESGISLIAVTPESEDARSRFVRYLSVRRYCHMRLAELSRLAPEALQLYRAQVDPLAERWYQAALTDRDPVRLEQIADEMFLSSYGDQAVWHLGSAALERGEYRRARMYWERTSPLLRFPGADDPRLAGSEGRSWWWMLRDADLDDTWDALKPLLTSPADRPSWMAYPDTEISLADVRARLVLVSILEGDLPRARNELEVFRRLHPDAKGRFGSQRGKYVAILGTLLARRPTWPVYRPDDAWTTLGGEPARGKVAAADVDVALRPIWQVELPRCELAGMSNSRPRLRVGEAPDGLLSYHPVVSGDLVVTCTGSRETDFEAVRLHTGEMVFPRGEPLLERGRDPRAAGLVWGVPRYTMSVHGNRLYARIGSPVTGASFEPGRLPVPPGRLVGLDLGAERKLFLDIRLDASDWGDDWAFDGSPVTDGAFLYAALRRRDSVRAEAHLACFDAHSGSLRWRRSICAAEIVDPTRPYDVTHNLLTLDEGTLYFNTNLGAVAALRARDGDCQWLTTYPRVALQRRDPDRNERHRFRDLNPCLVAGGTVFVAPRDTPAVFALDATTGHLLWVNQRAVDAIH
ncbi:MAG: PQQ-binding-like beta-propeller repeat protein, partial [Pirellulaceae bacterium]